MEEKEQEISQDNQVISPVAKDRTFGERAYDITFNNIINFWVNLLLSAGFTFWVMHSKTSIKLPGQQTAAVPIVFKEKVGNWINRRFFMQPIKDPIQRMERSQSMAMLVTLLTPGHFIMIPSVWLAPKIKAPFVKFFDRMHYGDAAMDDPTIQYRHRAIEEEARPTLFGAVVGRTGAFLASQAVGRLGGTPNNWFNRLGELVNVKWLKEFGGMDPLADRIGKMIGQTLEHTAPTVTGKIDDFVAQHNYTVPDNKSLQKFSRYVTTDMLYTLVTSVTVHPIINLLKNYIPGLTYTPKVEHTISPAEMKKMHLRSNPIADRAEISSVETTPSTDTPHIRVSDIKTSRALRHRRSRKWGHMVEMQAPATPTKKRDKTSGEIIFDVGTYGGLALVGNELLSTVITQQAKSGVLKPFYEPVVNFFKNLKPLNRIKYIGAGQLPYILTACIGGFVLMLPIKWMEDRKGSIVRKLDNAIHGANSDRDPKLAHAHREMDRAPKQSWASLWDGRMLTVGAALAVDALIGWPQALSTKLFDKPGRPNDFASYDRISVTLVRKIAGMVSPERKPVIDGILATVHNAEERYKINPALEGKKSEWLARGVGLLTLSTLLTILFYVSTKMFARHIETKHEEAITVPAKDGITTADNAALPQADETPNQPTSKVAQVENLSRVQEPSQPSVGV